MSRSASTAKKAVPLCCVTIGYQSFLLPTTDGMALVKLMQSAFQVQKGYDTAFFYEVGEQPEVEFSIIKAAQVRARATDTNARGERLLGVPD